MRQTQESEQHDILYRETAESTEKYCTGKLKSMGGQHQATVKTVTPRAQWTFVSSRSRAIVGNRMNMRIAINSTEENRARLFRNPNDL